MRPWWVFRYSPQQSFGTARMSQIYDESWNSVLLPLFAWIGNHVSLYARIFISTVSSCLAAFLRSWRGVYLLMQTAGDWRSALDRVWYFKPLFSMCLDDSSVEHRYELQEDYDAIESGYHHHVWIRWLFSSRQVYLGHFNNPVISSARLARKPRMYAHYPCLPPGTHSLIPSHSSSARIFAMLRAEQDMLKVNNLTQDIAE